MYLRVNEFFSKSGIFIGNILTNAGSFQYIIIRYYSRMRFLRASLFNVLSIIL